METPTPFALIPHPLARDGFSQLDRRNDALSPDAVAIDGRKMGDLLQFLYEYARQVNYYKDDHEFRAGDWVPFFQKSIPFQYAIIGGFDLESFERQYEEVAEGIDRRLSFTSLNLLFDLIFDMASQLEQWLANLEADTSGLKTAIENLIDTNLRDRLRTVIGLANAAGKWGYQRRKDPNRLARYWQLSVADIYRVDSTILTLRGSRKNKVRAAKSILEELFRTFQKGLEAIAQIANDEEQLARSLTNDGQQNHEPHLGLLFAFLLLFKELQGNLNSLSTSHLDFFYRKTLQLKEGPVVPDRAHLVFELAKNVQTDVLLEKGRRFRAGKDDNGEELFFTLDEEVVLTKTKVGSLRTLFIEQGDTGAFIPERLSAVYGAPVANSADGIGEEDFAKEQIPSWKTVGGRRSKWTDPDSGQVAPHPFARLGFVVASKVLLLREGKRCIRLTIDLADECVPDNLASITASFFIFLTTEKGWMSVEIDENENPVARNVTIDFAARKISLELELADDFPPVVYPGPDSLSVDYGHRSPMIKLELDQEEAHQQAGYENPYYWLRVLRVVDIHIDVFVCDVRNLVVQNDQAVMDVSKPFQPFGPIPKKDSSSFLIGSEEIFCKNWRSIDINVLWKGLPKEDFDDYYKGYPDPPEKGDFTATLDVLSERNWIDGRKSGAEVEVKLFQNPGDESRIQKDDADACSPHVANAIYWHVERSWFGGASPCVVPATIQNGFSPDLQCGFLRLKLDDEDFRHDEYSDVLTKQLLSISEAVTVDPTTGTVQSADTGKVLLLDSDVYLALKNALNTAGTSAGETLSKINNIFSGPITQWGANRNQAAAKANDTISSIGNSKTHYNNLFDEVEIKLPNEPYTPLIETISVDYHARATSGDKDVAFTHLHPWNGNYESFFATDLADPPGKKPSILPCFIDEGALYIGLENYQPGSNVNLLFQMEPSTADPDVDKAVVCWEYLRHNTWKPLNPDSEVLSDGTEGLIRSGIVQIAVPPDISSEKTTILPGEYHWLKARVLLRTAAVSETLSVSTQAAEVVFSPHTGNDLARPGQPLAAGSLTKLETPVAAVKGVSQPYAGFGGRAKEAPATFYRRISERLRHKGRAVSLYDYEHLVLQAFPEVYKVKCITHTLGRRGEKVDYELAPGFVTVVVVPDLEKVNAVDIFQPRLPAATLQAIKAFLKKRTTPFIKLEVLNPIYEPVFVRAKVQFKKGKSVSYYLGRLEKDVQGFLAPWSVVDTRQDISFGGQIYYSLILDFMENRPYVDFILDLTISREDRQPTDVIRAQTSRSVLTSGKEHFLISPPTANDLLQRSNLSGGSGIGFDIIPE